jgi:hypothetical protein
MAEITTVERLLGLMSEPGMPAKIAAAQALAAQEARIGDRKKLIARKRRIERDAEEKAVKLNADAAAATEIRIAKQKELAEAVAVERAANGAVFDFCNACHSDVGAIDATLRRDGDPDGAIAQFVEKLDAMHEIERRVPCVGHQVPISENSNRTVAWSDHLSRARLLRAIREAQVAAGALRLEALTPSEIIERLGAIADGLPAVQVEKMSVAA